MILRQQLVRSGLKSLISYAVQKLHIFILQTKLKIQNLQLTVAKQLHSVTDSFPFFFRKLNCVENVTLDIFWLGENILSENGHEDLVLIFTNRHR